MSVAIDQLLDEKRKLDFRIYELKWFQGVDAFKRINPSEASMINAQVQAMEAYSKILSDRISAIDGTFKKGAPGSVLDHEDVVAQTASELLVDNLPEEYASLAIKNLVSGDFKAGHVFTALKQGFDWGKTPEGSDFWVDVTYALMHGLTLPPIPKQEEAK
jgi:hypothetical protein